MSLSSTELKSKVYRAGAGAGKTFTLVHEVLQLAKSFYQQHQRFPNVVVTTFTRKATEELRERLMQKVLEWQDWDLLKFVTTRSLLHISTIHGVLTTYLVRHGHEFGVDPSFQIMSEGEVRKVARQILRSLLIKDERNEELLEVFSLNDLVENLLEYSTAKQHWPNLRLAEEIAFLAVYQNQCQDLADKIRDVSEKISSDCADWAEAWKKLALDLEVYEKNLLSGDWSQQQMAQEWSHMKFPQNRARKGEYPISPLVAQAWDSLKKEVKDFTENPTFNQTLWPRFWQGQEQFHRLALDFHDQFRSQCLKAGQITMLDIELLGLEGMRQFPETAENFSQHWDYWFIDEFQDTSPLQVELFRHMVGQRPKLIVGDPQQSIYLFRGADVGVFAAAENDNKLAGGEFKELQKNYRSEPELLLFLNDFFSRLKEPFRSMEPTGMDQGINAKKTVAYFAVGSSPTESIESNDECSFAELSALSFYIGELLAKGARLDEICVLARTRKQLQIVAEDLSRRGFPTRIHSSAGFWQRREIKDCVVLLAFMVNPLDNKNFVELLRTPWFLVSDEAIAKVINISEDRDRPYWDLFRLAAQQDERNLASILELEKLLLRSREVGITCAVQEAICSSGLMDWSHKHDSTGQRESNLWKFLTRLRSEERRPGFNFFEFIKGSGLVGDSDAMGVEDSEAVAALEPNRIHLMTVHGSKGLQFNHVLLPFCDRAANLSTTRDYQFVVNQEHDCWGLSWPILDDDDKLHPSPLGWEFSRRQRERERSENLRLLYVALTRAKKTVFISWTGQPKSDSWLAAMGWPADDVGLTATANYQYEISHGPWPESLWRPGLVTPAEAVRPVFGVEDVLEEGLKDIGQGRQSITQIIEGQQASFGSPLSVAPEDLLSVLSLAQRGTMIHRLFELIKYSSTEDLTQYVNEWFMSAQAEVSKALSFVLESEDPPLLSLVQNGHVEWGFLMRDTETGGTLEGQIDLWGKVDGQLWLIDYKTGSSRYSDKARAQLTLYARALVALGYASGHDKIHCAAVYPFEAKVVSWQQRL